MQILKFSSSFQKLKGLQEGFRYSQLKKLCTWRSCYSQPVACVTMFEQEGMPFLVMRLWRQLFAQPNTVIIPIPTRPAYKESQPILWIQNVDSQQANMGHYTVVGVGSGKANIRMDSVQRITGMKMGKVCNFLDKQRDTPRLWMCQVDIIATDETFSMLVTSISFHGSGEIFDDGCLFFKHWRI